MITRLVGKVIARNSGYWYKNGRYRGQYLGGTDPSHTRSRGRKVAPMKHLGKYKFPHDPAAVGELVIDGRRTQLLVHSPHSPAPVAPGTTLQGEAFTGERITLIDCASTKLTGPSHGRGSEERYSTEIFPHHVILGQSHLDPEQPVIDRIEFATSDLHTLFYDFDAFGTVIDSSRIIDTVLEERRKLRPVSSGDHPLVAYFSGKFEIISVPTGLGIVSAEHRPTFPLGGGCSGMHIKSQIVVSIVPVNPIVFEEAMDRILVLTLFLSVAAGRAQGIHRVRLQVKGADVKRPEVCDVFTSHQWKLRPGPDSHKPHPGEIPLSPIDRPEEFRSVLAKWLEKHEGWRVARVRYHRCLKKTNHYDAERLIAAANMFDLLPKEAVPMDRSIPPELANTRDECIRLLKRHPNDIDTNSVLGALGRMGEPSLPKKVAHRAGISATKLGSRFADLEWVAGVAVKCRNVFVHGDKGELPMAVVEEFMSFLTDTLEFIFVTSDFIEDGWDTDTWLANPTSWGHSFARFRWHYVPTLAELKRALCKK